MRELAATGYMSNRGRQIVASHLTKGMGIDRRWGAYWFENHLIDYDPCVNWGNWQYVAGVGTDPRDRQFNVRRQAKTYDPRALFVRRWCPELSGLDDASLIAMNVPPHDPLEAVQDDDASCPIRIDLGDDNKMEGMTIDETSDYRIYQHGITRRVHNRWDSETARESAE